MDKGSGELSLIVYISVPGQILQTDPLSNLKVSAVRQVETIALGKEAPPRVYSFPAGLITLQVQILKERIWGDPESSSSFFSFISTLVKHSPLLAQGREFGFFN